MLAYLLGTTWESVKKIQTYNMSLRWWLQGCQLPLAQHTHGHGQAFHCPGWHYSSFSLGRRETTTPGNSAPTEKKRGFWKSQKDELNGRALFV